MSAVHVTIIVVWAVFWAYWLGSALAGMQGHGTWVAGRAVAGREVAVRLTTGVGIVGLLELLRLAGLSPHSLAVHGPAPITLGLLLLLAGLAFAVWARVHLGRNWGMPMTQRATPELITSGPYTYVRHPIYSGLLLAGLGTAVAINLIGVGIVLLVIPYFVLAARVEEHNLLTAFPDTFPAYRARSKMLIPFLL